MKTFSKLTLTATFGLALALTFFGCGGDGGGDEPSSSSNYVSSSGNYEADSSSSEGEGISSSGNDEATSSSSGDEIDASSSSEGEDTSSSSNDEAASSSSGDEIDTSSSSEGEDISSSSNDEAVSSSSAVTGNSSSSESNIQGGFIDGYFIDPRDGKKYSYEIASNGQAWMIDNLNYSRDNTLGYCYGVDINGADPHRDAAGCDDGYGRAYTWETAMDGNTKRGLCPNGWHIPSVEEWTSLMTNPSTGLDAHIDIGGNINMPICFNIQAGNYNTNSEYPPLGWKSRKGYTTTNDDPSAFYYTSNGYNYFIWSGGNLYINIQNAAGMNEYFSVRCVADNGLNVPPPNRNTCIERINAQLGVCNALNEGNIRRSGNYDYYCENRTWREITDEEKRFGFCNASMEGSVAGGYICKNSTWREATDDEKRNYSLGGCGVLNEGNAKNYNDDYYICENGAWLVGTCNTSNEGKVVIDNGDYYKCKNGAWLVATTVNDVLGICNASNEGEIGSYNGYYTCQNNTWQKIEECSTELMNHVFGNGRICSSYNVTDWGIRFSSNYISSFCVNSNCCYSCEDGSWREW